MPVSRAGGDAATDARRTINGRSFVLLFCSAVLRMASMGKRRPPPLLLAVAVLVLSLAAASEAAARRKSSRKLSSGNDLGGEDGVAAEDLIPIPDHYLLSSDDQAAADDEDDFDDYEYDEAENVGEDDDRVGKKRESSSLRLSSRTLSHSVSSRN